MKLFADVFQYWDLVYLECLLRLDTETKLYFLGSALLNFCMFLHVLYCFMKSLINRLYYLQRCVLCVSSYGFVTFESHEVADRIIHKEVGSDSGSGFDTWGWFLIGLRWVLKGVESFCLLETASTKRELSKGCSLLPLWHGQKSCHLGLLHDWNGLCSPYIGMWTGFKWFYSSVKKLRTLRFNYLSVDAKIRLIILMTRPQNFF